MGTKNNPGAFDCYANAAPDEPMFILLGRDKHAPTLVWLWAALRELDGENPDKVAEARACVGMMMDYAIENGRRSVGLGQSALAAVMELIRSANTFARAADERPVVNAGTSDDIMRRCLGVTEFENAADAELAQPRVAPASPKARFTRLDDGYIHDAQLGLEWYAKSLEGKSWQDAMDKVATIGDGWRAPTVDELASLCDRTRRQPACDPIFDMPHDDWHWSSSPVVGWPEGAWFVLFNLGYVDNGYRYLSGFVRPVRAARPRQ